MPVDMKCDGGVGCVLGGNRGAARVGEEYFAFGEGLRGLWWFFGER